MLELHEINTFRGPAHILRGISLTVKEREVVCLVGRNGAGKTTTMESIMGLLPVRSGTISFHGERIAGRARGMIGRVLCYLGVFAEEFTGLPPHQRAVRGMGYAPEDCGIFPELTVAENLRISQWLSKKSSGDRGSSANGDVEERVYSVFPEVRDLTQREGIHLSGGEKKMVAIARAMALSPSLLLLDEAFEGLAPVVVNRFREAVNNIKDMGLSVLIAESNLAIASRVADRMYAIDRGEIIFHGDPQEALDNEEVMKALRG